MSLRRAVDITTHVYKQVVANNYTAKKRVFYSRAVVEKTLEEFSNLASDSLKMQGKFFYKDYSFGEEAFFVTLVSSSWASFPAFIIRSIVSN